MSPVHVRLHEEVTTTPVVLYMKGTGENPYCGFSATLVKILKELKVPFKDVNVLENEEVRQGIKDYSNWPTFPQLYIEGEFVGGCDIVREMHACGELELLLKEKGIL